eukprot:1205382-Rhodomonas_salina.2
MVWCYARATLALRLPYIYASSAAAYAAIATFSASSTSICADVVSVYACTASIYADALFTAATGTGWRVCCSPLRALRPLLPEKLPRPWLRH